MPMKDQLSILLYKAKLFAFSETKGKPGASRILAHDDYDQNEHILSSRLDTSISWRCSEVPRPELAVGGL